MRWLVAGVALSLAAPLAAQSLPPALQRATANYDSLASLTADFAQTITNPMLGAPERSRGTLVLRKPGRFAMRFSDPAGDRIVADGTWLWLYTPSTTPGQVLRQAIPATGHNSPNLFGQFVDHPAERYIASDAGTDSVNGVVVDLVRLVPKDSGTGFREVTLGIARDGSLRALRLVEESGQRRDLTFDHIRRNPTVPDSEVAFTPPRGVKIVSPR